MNINKMRNNPHILVLQGPASMFFATLGAILMRNGAQVTRLTFCPGDRLFWRRKSGQRIAFRHNRKNYAGFLMRVLERHKITDIICLGDGRFWHAEMIKTCKNLPTPPKIHIIEHGYYRPGWLTLERGGINANSHFPRQADVIRRIAKQCAEPASQTFNSSFLRYASLDIIWNLSNILLAPFSYPRFKTHALDHPIKEWQGWIKKAITGNSTRRKLAIATAQIAAHSGPKFLFPLQLATDYQIRAHGPKTGIFGAITDTINSFASFAPKNAMLIFKIHPLDNGHQNWAEFIGQTAREFDCYSRVVFMSGGDLEQLLDHCAGCITINSTVGLSAINKNIATHVLGRAIFDIVGLCDPQEMSTFWLNPEKPDANLARDFRRALISTTQIAGAFEGSGAKIGAKNIAAKILAFSRTSSE